MRNKKKLNGVIGIFVIVLLFLLLLQQLGIFKDPNIKYAEKRFSEVNGFSVDITEIDTFTNERFAKILIKDFGKSFKSDSLMRNPNGIHHYRLEATRNKKTSKYQNIYGEELRDYLEFSLINGGLTVNKNFKCIENPLYYRVERAIKRAKEKYNIDF